MDPDPAVGTDVPAIDRDPASGQCRRARSAARHNGPAAASFETGTARGADKHVEILFVHEWLRGADVGVPSLRLAPIKTTPGPAGAVGGRLDV